MDIYEFDADCLVEREMTLADLAQDEAYLSKGYAYYRGCSDEVKEFLKPILRMADDQFCNSCYAMGIENPAEVDFSKYLGILVSKEKM